MTLAYDYPLLSIFLSMMWFFILIAWIMTVFQVIVDVFRSRDMGGFAKAIWLIFILLLPFLGVLIYLVSRGDKMAMRAAEDARERDAAMQSYVREVASGGGPADEIAKLAALRDAGSITEAEFQSGKAKILA